MTTFSFVHLFIVAGWMDFFLLCFFLFSFVLPSSIVSSSRVFCGFICGNLSSLFKFLVWSGICFWNVMILRTSGFGGLCF